MEIKTTTEIISENTYDADLRINTKDVTTKWVRVDELLTYLNCRKINGCKPSTIDLIEIIEEGAL